MKKNIEILIATAVHIAVVHEWNDEFLSKDWNVYILNSRSTPIDMVLIVSKGYDGDKKTATMRHSLGLLKPKSFKKIEMIYEEVFELTNEFFITFFVDDKLFERKFIFPKNSISEKNLVTIPLIDNEGVFAQ